MDEKIEAPAAIAADAATVKAAISPSPAKQAVEKPVAENPAAKRPAPKSRGTARKARAAARAETAETPQHHLAQMRHDPAAIRRVFETGEYPYAARLRTAPYEEHMLKLQQELLKAQRWVELTGERIVMLFEGRDAAGKGGTIKRYMEHMNPRTARVVALQKPTERESSQWYFQRYVSQLPAGGEICLFDRSWYNRAGVERVMGFCSEIDVEEFFRSVPEFERMLARSGIKLIKYWFSVSREE
ncbi:MAG: polyphosphate kinase 2, partial [Rhodoblastus sp.]